MFYSAQLSIACVDGFLYACQGTGDQIEQFNDFLRKYDHEGSALTLSLRRDPDSIQHIYDPDTIYRELECHS